MTRDEFLQAIRATPDDVTLRLVFADWLEEQNDPLAEFIRLQCELEPIRYAQEDPCVKALRLRERALLDKYSLVWLGPYYRQGEGEWLDYREKPLVPVFRYGMVDEVHCSLAEYLQDCRQIHYWCPVFQHLTLFNARHYVPALTRVRELTQCRRLEFPDGITVYDAEALAECSYLHALKKLTLWLTGHDDEEVCRKMAESSVLNNLKQIELVPVWSGLSSNEFTIVDDSSAKYLAETINKIRSDGFAIVKPSPQEPKI